MFANMHNHSTFSDGIYTPEEIVKMANDLGYKAIVLTDHDTVQGTYFMQKAARKEDLLTLLGCEFSTVEYGVGFHLLGFDFNPDEPGIRKLLGRGAGNQKNRTELLLQWAQEKGGVWMSPGMRFAIPIPTMTICATIIFSTSWWKRVC